LGERAACATGSWKYDKNNKNIVPAPSSKSHENLNLPDPVTVFRQKKLGRKVWMIFVHSFITFKQIFGKLSKYIAAFLYSGQL